MVRVLLILFLGISFESKAWAQDEPLPENVKTPYQAYQEAREAGDDAVAYEMAALAYENAVEVDVEGSNLGNLAEIYARWAAEMGDIEIAYEAWRHAAEVSDEIDDTAVNRAWRWRNVAQGAYLLGETRAARNALRRALDLLEDVTEISAWEANIIGDVNYLSARMQVDSGRLSLAAAPAARALEAYEWAGAEPDDYFASTYYLKGLGSIGRGRWDEAAYEFHMARDIFRSIGSQDSEYYSAEAFLVYAIQRATLRDGRQYERAIEASELHAYLNVSHLNETGEESSVSSEHEGDDLVVLSQTDGYVDASPRGTRRPPHYPMSALNSRIEGVTIVRFDVTEEGDTENIEILAQLPGTVFGQVSENAVDDWRYNPATVDGEPVYRRGVMVHFWFEVRS